MHLVQAIIMGIVQGLSEFLPISSSAHLVFASALYKLFVGSELSLESSQEIVLDMMLHLGTLFAVFVYYRKKLVSIIKSFFFSIKNNDYSSDDTKLGGYIISGTFVTIFVALLLHNTAEMLVFKPNLVGVLLIFTGLFLLICENLARFINKSKPNSDEKRFSVKDVILISIAQGLACLPGFSRSGLTIATGILLGHTRTKSADFSFLLSVPIILGASIVYPLLKVDFSELLTFNWLAILVGVVVSAITGYFCIKYFIKFLAKFSLAFFGGYCLIIGILAAIFLG